MFVVELVAEVGQFLMMIIKGLNGKKIIRMSLILYISTENKNEKEVYRSAFREKKQDVTVVAKFSNHRKV